MPSSLPGNVVRDGHGSPGSARTMRVDSIRERAGANHSSGKSQRKHNLADKPAHVSHAPTLSVENRH